MVLGARCANFSRNALVAALVLGTASSARTARLVLSVLTSCAVPRRHMAGAVCSRSACARRQAGTPERRGTPAPLKDLARGRTL
jgi:hypothetical protein